MANVSKFITCKTLCVFLEHPVHVTTYLCNKLSIRQRSSVREFGSLQLSCSLSCNDSGASRSYVGLRAVVSIIWYRPKNGGTLRLTELCRAFANRRGYLMSLSRITTWPTWSLQLSEINNIMYAVKTLYRSDETGMRHRLTSMPGYA